MKKMLLVLVLLLGVCSVSAAQVVVPPSGNRSVRWDHDMVDTDKYVLKSDSVIVTDNIAVTPCDPDCGGPITAGLRVFQTPFPALTPGNHTLTVEACNLAGCNASEGLAIRLIVIPSRPLNLRLAVTPQ